MATEAAGETGDKEILRIVLIGKTGNGKSSSGNTILGRKGFVAKPSQKSVTKKCKRQEVEVEGRKVIVVDTPGLFDTNMSIDDINKEKVNCINLLDPGPHVFLLVLQIGRLTPEEKKVLKLIKQGFGKKVEEFTIILFTHGDKLEDQTIEEYIEDDCDDYFKQLISDCGNRYHVFKNKGDNDRTQVKELMKKIDDMVKQNNGGYYTTDMLKEAEKSAESIMGYMKRALCSVS